MNAPPCQDMNFNPMQENHLALRSEGVKMVVDSKQPHFVGVDPDLLSTGLVFYYLKVCAPSLSINSTACVLYMTCMSVSINMFIILCTGRVDYSRSANRRPHP